MTREATVREASALEKPLQQQNLVQPKVNNFSQYEIITMQAAHLFGSGVPGTWLVENWWTSWPRRKHQQRMTLTDEQGAARTM